MEAQIVILVVGLLIAFLPFGRGNGEVHAIVSTQSSVMSAIMNQAQTIGFQSGDCGL